MQRQLPATTAAVDASDVDPGGGRELRPWALRAARSSTAVGCDEAVAAIIAALTSPPAVAGAAAVRSLARDLPQGHDWRNVDIPASILAAAAARAAAAAATVAAADVAASASEVANTNDGGNSCGAAPSPIWPLSARPLQVLADGSDDADPAAAAAATAVLESVSATLLDTGIMAVRDAVTRVRGVALEKADLVLQAGAAAGPPRGMAAGAGSWTGPWSQRASEGAPGRRLGRPRAPLDPGPAAGPPGQQPTGAGHGASAGWGADGASGGASVAGADAAEAEAAEARAVWGRVRALLVLPYEVSSGVAGLLAAEARRMSGRQLAAVLAAVGSLALRWPPAVEEALTDRALQLLAAASPSQGRQGPADAGPAVALPPALAALLMLLLVAVLPMQLSKRKVRWLMWWPFRTALLAGRGEDLHPLQPLERGMESGAPADRRGARDAAEALPLVAVAALVAASVRLQLRIAGTPEEAAALQRIAGEARGLSGRRLATLLRVLTAEKVVLETQILDKLVLHLDALARDGAFPPRELLSLLADLGQQGFVWRRSQASGMLGCFFDPIAAMAVEQQEDERAAAVAVGAARRAALPKAVAVAAERAAARGALAEGSAYSREAVVAACGELEDLVGRLQLTWADPAHVDALRDQLSRFAASGGSRPLDVFLAWRTLIRAPSWRPSAAQTSADDLDAFIAGARAGIIGRAGGASFLEGAD
ncbi:hypothetical protein GPECTOR_9g563 [Gonium pectorale]|uniref:Uncharacterized protein n=1 Tax=Gonium pectorale TaxID=33097 RepID=A0A150GRQ8_GONPE|nr:hypothetical protein GPECTOR_9g563 [Gonium pectorale]|eukprot:KXZ52519.1 hypothetical protein GPECTOR_9g563 [Gonium pectorale]